MLHHIGLKVKDLAASKRFYAAALAPLGFAVQYEDPGTVGFGPKGGTAFYLAQGASGGPMHVAFAAPDHAAVAAFHAAALRAGGKDNGAPGPRPDYGAHYYAAFIIDPDGNNAEAVCLKG